MANTNLAARVVILKDGPYIVTGSIPLTKQTIAANANGDSETWTNDKTFVAQEKYALCRCGQSNNKPFCDGTHVSVGFNGTETASREQYVTRARVFDGPEFQLRDDESLCAFARYCDPHGKVWNQVEHTDDLKMRATFIRQVQDCPSGRLVVWDKAAEQALEKDLPISIGLVEDPVQACSEPLWLQGGIGVVSADGFEYEVRNRVTLCRCGYSKNKPLCDGTHASTKFQDA